MTAKNAEKTASTFEITSGAIVQLGRHRIACGNATDISLVHRLLDGTTIDLLLTDPPYGVAAVESKPKQGERHQKILNDHRQTDAEYEAFTKAWLSPIADKMSAYNSVYIFNADPMIFALRSAMHTCGFSFKQLLIWLKKSPIPTRLDYMPQHELIAYGWKGKHRRYKSMDKALICEATTKNNVLHPTMKPLPLLRRLILNSSKVGDVVYDAFLGSGSCLIACEHTQRTCYGIEMDPVYIQRIMKRWEGVTGQTAVLLHPLPNHD